MLKCKIVIQQSIRSDFGHSDPIIKLLQQDPLFDLIIMKLVASSYRGAYATAKNLCLTEKPDIFLVIGDRIEAAGATAGMYHNEQRPYIIHYGSGTINGKVATIDDKNRHCIMIYSDMQLCEDYGSLVRALDVMKTLSLDPNGSEVGLTLHDEIDIIDTEMVPDEPYDLILYNPTTLYNEDILSLLDIADWKLTIWVESNADPTSIDYFNIVKEKHKRVVFIPNQTRPRFLGLLKHCDKYMSNSSNCKTEAPFFKKEEDIIPIGDRNLLRSTAIKRTEKASEKIVNIIKDYWRNKNGKIE